MSGMCMRLKESERTRGEERRSSRAKILYTFHLSNWIIHMSIYFGCECGVFHFFFSLSLWFCLQSFQFIFVACNEQRITYSLTRSFASKTHSHTNLSCSPFPFWCSFILFLLLLLELPFFILFSSLSLSVSINLWVFVRKVHNAELKNCSPQKRLNFYALIQRDRGNFW